MSFDEFKTEWLGKRIDYDHVYQYQCVDLILEYIKECYGISNGVWGNAIDYWVHPSSALLNKFHRIGGNDALQGDIVIFNGNAGNPYGHIGIATGNIDSVNVEILEQNGATGGGTGTGGDAIRTRAVSRNRVAGLLRPIEQAVSTPVSQPAIASNVAYTPLAESVTVTAPTLEVRSEPHTTAARGQANTPDGSLHQGNVAGVTGWTHGDSVNNNTVWLRSVHGHWFWSGGTNFNLAQVLPPPVVAPPLPPVPPPAVSTPPAAPVPIPTDTSPYQVVKLIDGYSTGNRAANRINQTVPVGADTYYIFNRYYSKDTPPKLLALNVTKKPGQPGAWINVEDNVLDPVPPPPQPSGWPTFSTPPPAIETVAAEEALASPDDGSQWKATYTTFKNAQGQDVTEKYVFMQSWQTKDIEGKSNRTVNFNVYDELDMSGYFHRVNANGIDVKYYRPAAAAKVFRFFGVPQTDERGQPVVLPENVVYNSNTSVAERRAVGSTTAHDRYIIGLGKAKATVTKLESILDNYGPRIMDIVKRKK